MYSATSNLEVHSSAALALHVVVHRHLLYGCTPADPTAMRQDPLNALRLANRIAYSVRLRAPLIHGKPAQHHSARNVKDNFFRRISTIKQAQWSRGMILALG